jgi:hypothetical protein
VFKVFESFDYMEAGRVRSLLEAHGIRTFMKNEYLSGALGDLPFPEVAPMVFVVEASDLPAALALLRDDQGESEIRDSGDDAGVLEA